MPPPPPAASRTSFAGAASGAAFPGRTAPRARPGPWLSSECHPGHRPGPALLPLPLQCSMQCPRRPCGRTTSSWQHLLPLWRWRSSRRRAPPGAGHRPDRYAVPAVFRAPTELRDAGYWCRAPRIRFPAQDC
ncbi:hypothetical protein PVAP13_8NG240300 [Panicum virgatum]|uniref:Uncharacterized protein n=1 Tax=Panicum virgatum TaxID=38727 RepID=A0A8T0PFN4_PANVG|nr:hypothetical protein PVAP13_8NG240300 [Panicum virgatum]